VTKYQEWVWSAAIDIARWSGPAFERMIGDYVSDSYWYTVEDRHETVLRETRHPPTLEDIAKGVGPLDTWEAIRKFAVWLAMTRDLAWAVNSLVGRTGRKRWTPMEW